MAKKNAHVVMLNRRQTFTINPLCSISYFSFRSERSQAALKTLKDEFPNASITAVDCDLMDFSSVRKAADEVKTQFSNGIDVLCNNAGIMADEDKATKDGIAPNPRTCYDIKKQIFGDV